MHIEISELTNEEAIAYTYYEYHGKYDDEIDDFSFLGVMIA